MSENLQKARQLDSQDPLASFRDQFHLPLHQGKPQIYFVGNSLGLQPKRTSEYVGQELEAWQTLGVRGHFEGAHPWMPYHEFLTETMADLVGGKSEEVVMMNSLTANLHLMMATFYRPTADRNKILLEAHSFPSDFQAVQSQIKFHGYDPKQSMVLVRPEADDQPISHATIVEAIEQNHNELALILLPGVQYYTGQVFDIQAITKVAKKYSIPVGFDLAHAAGNIQLKLHDWGVDFAVWCSYKYLNSGPGSIGGCFVHQDHARQTDKVRFAGWWGHDKATRFQMKNDFNPIPTAEGWQLSNPPILSLAAIRASLDVFKEAGGVEPLVAKAKLQTAFFVDCLQEKVGDRVEVITPSERGCQLSLKVVLRDLAGKEVHRRLEAAGAETDWREPNVIRVAPVPLYNTFEEIHLFVELLSECIDA
ncbi:kynureninase [bacterium]|nr:kynureninase [bacterium]